MGTMCRAVRPSDDGPLGHRGSGGRRRRGSARGRHAGPALHAEPDFAVPRAPARQPRRDGDAAQTQGNRPERGRQRQGRSMRMTHPETPVDIVIYHNPECGTSRNALAMIRNAGIEPHVIEYLKTPPSRALLASLIVRASVTPRALLREKGTPFAELGLDNPDLTDAQLIDAMMEHPILINRPLVVSPLGVKLCRPSEEVLDLLPADQRSAFAKEDGEQVIDAAGRRVTG